MIIDTIENASKYFGVHPLFEKAFQYIQQTDLQNIEVSRFPIDGDNLKAIVSNKGGMTAAESTAKFECHNQHIDIQLCINGVEKIGWKPRGKCAAPKGGYNPDKDVQFYNDAPDTYFELTNGQFAIFFPEDVHAPMIGASDKSIKKLVIKVKIDNRMNTIKQVTSAITQQGILPLYFNPSEAISVDILRAIYRAGIKAVEYTNRGEAALKNFAKLVEVRNNEMPDMLLGIGTIKNLAQAENYIKTGANFLVSPGFVKEVADYAVSNDIFYAPGCMTPSEIIAAENAGVGFIKLFPGDMLGPKFLSSIKAIFPKLLFMPTGGVDTTRENIEGWYKAGVCAVGMGSNLISKKRMDEQDYAGIETASSEVLALIQTIKK
ncbi:MAG: YhcH/YjgK/YiaL family protein [Saprospiraceae bacterium]|nr:YhcH/YjgK/YiaL family protein [Saprospiraceae bacterium]